jgi:malate dehydrogenase (oxaloacetate-decarboxylating)(NADP+)
VTGLTRSFSASYADLRMVFDRKPQQRVFGFSIFIYRGRTVFLADTTVHERPSAAEMVEIARQTAAAARTLGHEPRVAFLSYSTFGNPLREFTESTREAVKLMDEQSVDFEYDGEMQVNFALNYELMKSSYPFCRLSGPANVLVMPGLHAANISAKLLQEFSGGTVIGPILSGFEKSVQVVQMNASVNDIVNTTAIGAHSGF